MNAVALQDPVSQLKGPSLTALFPASHLSGCHLPEGFQLSRSILPKPMGTGHGIGGGYPDAFHVNGCYAETLDRKAGSNFRIFISDPCLPAMDIIFNVPEAVSPDIHK
jgi:hypothetical protein